MFSEHFGGVAHRLEQAAHNRLVDGSIPSTPTISNITSIRRFFNLLMLALCSTFDKVFIDKELICRG